MIISGEDHSVGADLESAYQNQETIEKLQEVYDADEYSDLDDNKYIATIEWHYIGSKNNRDSHSEDYTFSGTSTTSIKPKVLDFISEEFETNKRLGYVVKIE